MPTSDTHTVATPKSDIERGTYLAGQLDGYLLDMVLATAGSKLVQ
jgi:hypothetical protein